jgi:hypothetical protein
MIHLNDALTKSEEKDLNGKPLPFAIEFIKLSTGEVVKIDKAIRAGLNHNMNNNATIGIRAIGSDQVRAVKIRLIKSFNNEKVFF